MITKQGSVLRGMGNYLRGIGEASKTYRFGRGLYNIGKSTGRAARKAADPTFSAVKSVGGKALGTADFIGKGIAKHPERALYAGIPLAVGAYKFPDTVKKHMAHSDPKQHFTTTTPMLQDIKVPARDKKMREHMRRLIAQQNKII